MTQTAGPPLETLLRRLVDIPPDFLDPPRTAAGGQVATAALVADLVVQHGGRATVSGLAPFLPGPAADSNRHVLTAIAVWLLSDDTFLADPVPAERLLGTLQSVSADLAAAGAAARYVHEPDRREELARVLLHRLDRVPAGETPAQAQDRLAAVSSVERRRLLDASRAAEARARAIREALARKAAEESADKWTRE